MFAGRTTDVCGSLQVEGTIGLVVTDVGAGGLQQRLGPLVAVPVGRLDLQVEAALTAGASHAAVLETLHAQGFTLTASSFESTLARQRKERKAGQHAESG